MKPTCFTMEFAPTAVALGLTFACAAAHAQAPTVDTAEGTLEEVVVTAERRSENLQNVPISATVLTGQDLKTRGVLDIQDLQFQTPGLSIQPPVNTEPYINIRGVGIQQQNPASSAGVAFYVDGQFVHSLVATVDSFYDLAGVEVLRGPQGTLLGANSDGGAIYVTSTQPTFDKIKGYIEQTLGNYADRRTEGAVNLPISDVLAARIAFVYETRNSFTYNVGPQPPTAQTPEEINQPGNLNYLATRLQLAYKPNEDMLFTLRYEPYQSRTDGFALKPDMSVVSATNPFYDPYAAHQTDPYVIDYDTPQFLNIQGQRTSLTAMWNTPAGVSVKGITSYQTAYEVDEVDLDGSSAPADLYSLRRTDLRSFTQEINVLSNSTDPLQWVAGAYFLSARDSLNLNLVNTGTPPIGSIALHLNQAAFASATYHFTDQWSVAIGGRYSHDMLPYHLLTEPYTSDTMVSDSKPTGSFKLSFQANPKTLLYASLTNGYKSGGANLVIPAIGFTPPPFPKETNVVAELGVKATMLDDHLRVDGDVFDSKYEHYQLQEYVGGLPLTQGPGDAKIYGSELELSGVAGGFTSNLGVAYLHGRVLGDFLYGAPAATEATITNGTTIPFAPTFTVTAGAQYAFNLPKGTLTPRLQYSYQGSQYTQITHALPPFNIDQQLASHSTTDVRLIYMPTGELTVEGYVTNLANKVYPADVTTNYGAPEYAYGAPRQWGVRLTYKYD